MLVRDRTPFIKSREKPIIVILNAVKNLLFCHASESKTLALASLYKQKCFITPADIGVLSHK
jgi:hypothetical protein